MARIVSGLTATGKLTLGNYIGAIRNLKKEQEKNNEIFMFVADLHALTLPIDPNILKNNIKENISLYLASGIDPKKVNLFVQSKIIGHTELFYILSVNSYQGELNRMTQFKDKLDKLTKKEKMKGVPVGLYIYPILMAADILLYNADEVIVGNDQKQHLELTRNIIDRLNKTYNLNFNIPEAKIANTGGKIMGLKKPLNKMSKSDNDIDNVIFLLDSEEEINRKISTSLTDSENKVYYDPKAKPGVSNLLTIYASMKEITIEQAEVALRDFDYRTFKENVAQSIIEVLKPIQDKFKKIDDKKIEESLMYNWTNIQDEAKNNLDKIYKGIGILNGKENK